MYRQPVAWDNALPGKQATDGPFLVKSRRKNRFYQWRNSAIIVLTVQQPALMLHRKAL
jgi:hypothetical protein